MTRAYRPDLRVLRSLWMLDRHKAKKRLLVCLGLFLLAYALVPKGALLEGTSFSRAVYSSEGKLLRLTLSKDDKFRLFEPLDAISALLIDTTLLYEDRYFYYHPGINPVSLLRAVWTTYIARSRKVGASTITMQLARLIYGIDSRTISGKIEQILRAFQLERHYSKDEILEAYINLAPYGGNIEGTGAASVIYFNKHVKDLTLSEAITLSVIPQNPKILFPEKNEIESGALIRARLELLSKWKNKSPHLTDEKEIMASMPIVTSRRYDLPFLAPHFVDAVLMENHGQAELETTLDFGMQQIVEMKVKNYIERKKGIGILNASAMLVDYKTMEVKAVVGSADFFNDSIEGQVNGTRAKRSPGSTLKPFIYALALEQGLIHSMTMVKDAPFSFSSYNPENFDEDFEGPIKAVDALNKSRNLPAVYLAGKLKNPSLYSLIEMAEISDLKEEGFYGLAIVLGGIELTMEELIKLYAMLANGGLYQNLKTLKGVKRSSGKRLLSEEASAVTVEMLKRNSRPGESLNANWLNGAVPVAWKTGTSFAFRDGWATGIVGDYVLAVWIGNFDGKGNAAFTGRAGAAPLFFEIVDAIKFEKGFESEHPLPNGVREIEVCAVSGGLPGKYCKNLIKTLFIPGKSPIAKCDIHREIKVDIKTGLRSCSDKNVKTEVFEFWPSDLLAIFRLAGISRRLPPLYDPGCKVTEKAAFGSPPEIKSPQKGVIYNLRVEKVGEETIPFSAVSDADVRNIYWFVDKKMVGRSDAGDVLFWQARPGRYVVRAVDDHGRSDSEEISVALVE